MRLGLSRVCRCPRHHHRAQPGNRLALRAVLATVQLVPSHSVSRHRVSEPAAEQATHVLDAGPGRVHGPVALQDIVLHVGAPISSHVSGVPSGAGVRFNGGFFRPRIACVPPSSRRPWASQTGDHTFALVGREWKSVQAEANGRRWVLDRPAPRDRACTGGLVTVTTWRATGARAAGSGRRVGRTHRHRHRACPSETRRVGAESRRPRPAPG